MANRKSFGGIAMKAPKTPSFSSGRGNALMSMMMAQSMLPEKKDIEVESELEKQRKSLEALGEQIEGLKTSVGPFKPGAVGVREGITNPINPKYTVEQSKALGGSDMILAHLNEIEKAMESQGFPQDYMRATARLSRKAEKGSIGPVSATIGSESAGKLKFAINDLSNRLLYLRSGAQINENEFVRLASALPSFTHLLSDFDWSKGQFKGNYNELKNMIDAYRQDAVQIKQRLIEGGQFDDDFWSAPVPEEFIRNPKLHIYGSLAKRQDDMEQAITPGTDTIPTAQVPQIQAAQQANQLQQMMNSQAQPVQQASPIPMQGQEEDPFQKYMRS